MGDTLSQEQQQEVIAGAANSDLPNSAVPSACFASANQGGAIEIGTGGARQQGHDLNTQLCESNLLSQLVQLLGQRDRHFLLLSDLGALLPGPLRHGVKEKGGLRSWLQKYPQLFKVSGQPGKESVTLLLGAAEDAAANGPNASSRGPPTTHSAHHQGLMQAEAEAGAAADAVKKREEEEENESAVQLRGLPYRASVGDIRNFLGFHVQNTKGESAVQLVLNRDGRPSGFARVQFVSPEAARQARDDLHMQNIEIPGVTDQHETVNGHDRYVEIFLFSERPNKLRFKKTLGGDGDVHMAEMDEALALGISKDDIIKECRQHMAMPGKGQLLLSMLGVALSGPARTYLKKTDQGLKHFLGQYPQEFSVDGIKGRECITYIPAMASGGQTNSDLPMGFSDNQKKNNHNNRQTAQSQAPISGTFEDMNSMQPQHVTFSASGNIGEPRHLQQSPGLRYPESPKDTPGIWGETPARGLDTPSDWGTPQPQYMSDVKAAADKKAQAQATAAAQAPAYNHWSYWAMGGQPSMGMPSMGPAGLPPNWPQMAGPMGLPMGWPPQGQLPPTWNPVRPMDGEAASGMYPGMQSPEQSLLAASSAATLQATLAGMEREAKQALAGACDAAGKGGSAPGGFAAMPQQHLPLTQPQHLAPSAGQVLKSSSVRLRGLPFASGEQDVLAFFAKYDVVESIEDGSDAVRMLTKANGKPSGQAVVDMLSHADAQHALDVLNGQYMGSRYVEVFLHNENATDSGPLMKTLAMSGFSHDPMGAPAASSSAAGSLRPQPVGALLDPSPGLPAQMTTGHRFDGVGDTGGSGGIASGGTWPYQHSQNDQHVAASRLDAATLAMINHAMGQVQGPSHGGTPQTPTAGTGDGATKQEQSSSWEALFDFLKREPDPANPSPAALNGPGMPSDAKPCK